ncbi:MAG: sigma-54 dependent transcriptional regulator [Dissulfuribacterales bacterium]
MKKTILIVEDSKKLAELFEAALFTNYQVIKALNLKSAKNALNFHRPDGILLDLQLPDGFGLELIPLAKRQRPDCVIVVVTAFGSIQMAVEAMRLGAADFLEKPVDMEALPRVFAKHLALFEEDELVFASRDMEDVLTTAKRIAPLPFPVLITGETGVGKDMMARFIHRRSGRKEFIALNCANLTPELADSILFGHIKGSFTGATETKEGLVAQASGGTLFLDELCELPPAVQAKLLRFLDSGRYIPLGGTKELQSDVRILAATNQDPKTAVANGRMRQDLYYRLAVMTLDIQSLRKRIEDIPPLIQLRLSYLQNILGHEVTISQEAINLLTSHDFPGNVRELFNLLDRAAAMSHGAITPEFLANYIKKAEVPGNAHTGNTSNRNVDNDEINGSKTFSEPTLFSQTRKNTEEQERKLIQDALSATRYNKAAAARLLGVSYKTLLNKLKRYEML